MSYLVLNAITSPGLNVDLVLTFQQDLKTLIANNMDANGNCDLRSLQGFVVPAAGPTISG
jgi:hypothetical protein